MKLGKWTLVIGLAFLPLMVHAQKALEVVEKSLEVIAEQGEKGVIEYTLPAAGATAGNVLIQNLYVAPAIHAPNYTITPSGFNTTTTVAPVGNISTGVTTLPTGTGVAAVAPVSSASVNTTAITRAANAQMQKALPEVVAETIVPLPKDVNVIGLFDFRFIRFVDHGVEDAWEPMGKGTFSKMLKENVHHLNVDDYYDEYVRLLSKVENVVKQTVAITNKINEVGGLTSTTREALETELKNVEAVQQDMTAFIRKTINIGRCTNDVLKEAPNQLQAIREAYYITLDRPLTYTLPDGQGGITLRSLADRVSRLSMVADADNLYSQSWHIIQERDFQNFLRGDLFIGDLEAHYKQYVTLHKRIYARMEAAKSIMEQLKQADSVMPLKNKLKEEVAAVETLQARIKNFFQTTIKSDNRPKALVEGMEELESVKYAYYQLLERPFLDSVKGIKL